jgi:hypothetical protein
MAEPIHEPKQVKQERGVARWWSGYLAWRNKNRWKNFLGESRRGTPTTIINDCTDDNAKGRQETRVSSITGGPVNYVGLTAPEALDADTNRMQAAGHLIDQLDAFDDRPGVLCVHIAPRHANGESGHTANGSQYGYFWYKNVIVVTSMEGSTLSLVKKLGLADTVRALDVGQTLRSMHKKGLVSKDEIEKTKHTQFKSFEYLPRIGAFLLKEGKTAGVDHRIDTVEDAPRGVWFVDNFGNCKTTLVAEEFGFSSAITAAELKAQQEAERNGTRVGPLTHVQTKFGLLPLYRRLADAPQGQLALTIGSSGIGSGKGERRFIELTVLGGNAAALCKGLKIGDNIF